MDEFIYIYKKLPGKYKNKLAFKHRLSVWIIVKTEKGNSEWLLLKQKPSRT